MVDGNTTAVITTPGTLQGVIGLDVNKVTFTVAANYAHANVGINKTITVVYILGGSAKDNYTTQVDFVITGSKISDYIVLSPVVTPTPGCEGSDLDLAYTIVSGTSVEYRITFSAAALAAGIQNVSYTSMPSASDNGVILISIPQGTTKGNYQGVLQMRNELGIESPEYTFSFSI